MVSIFNLSALIGVDLKSNSDKNPCILSKTVLYIPGMTKLIHNISAHDMLSFI